METEYSKSRQLGKKKKNRQKNKNTIKKDEYKMAMEKHGSSCFICGSDVVEAHHVKFRSQGGRGTWRNTRFLCKDHTRGNNSPHRDENMRVMFQDMHIRLYGEHYYCDADDLYKLGKIEEPTKELMENFFSKCSV
jgi:hypothetical protein